MSDNVSYNKRIAQNAAYLYLRMLLIMGVSLFTVRVILNVFGVEDYGVYSAVAGFVSTMSFVSSVLTHASQRFLSIEIANNDIQSVKKVFGTIFITYIFAAVFVLFISETIGLWFVSSKLVIPDGRTNAVMWVYQFSILSFILSLLMNPFQALIIAREEMKIYAYISVFEVILKLAIVYVLLISTFDKLKLYSVLFFFSGVIVNITYLLICRRKYKETHISLSLDRKTFISIFSFSSWTLLGSIASVVNAQGINILLNLFFGPIANAAYAISSQVSNAINSLGFNFFTALRPPIIKAYANNDYSRLYNLSIMGSKAIFTLLSVFIIPLFVYMPTLLSIWLGDVKMYMVDFTRLMLIYTLILSMSNPLTAIAHAVGCVKLYHGLIDGLSILSLPLVYLLFKMGAQPVLAFYVPIILFSFYHLLRLYIVHKYTFFSIRTYITQIIMPILLIIVILIIVSFCIQKILIGDFIHSFLGMIIIAIVTLLLSFFILFSNNERKTLFIFLKKKHE